MIRDDGSMSTTVLYAYLDDKEVIYIGCTSRPRSRHREHVKRSSWYHPNLRYHTIGVYEGSGSRKALSVEYGLVRCLEPKGNVQFTRRSKIGV